MSSALVDAELTNSLFQDVFRAFLNRLADALSVKFSFLPFNSLSSFPANQKIDDKTTQFFVAKYWRSWRSYIGSLTFLNDFRDALARLSTSDINQVFDALLSLLPIESETFRKRRNVAEPNRMFSSFDELVGRLQNFNITETAKFDTLCCVINCIVADLMTACLIANGLRDPSKAGKSRRSAYATVPGEPLSDEAARVVISHCLLRIGRPSERTAHGTVATGADAAPTSAMVHSNSNVSLMSSAGDDKKEGRAAKNLERISRLHAEMPEEEWRYWRAKGWQHWARLLGLLSLHHLPDIVEQLNEAVELFRKESGSLARSLVFPISCTWFIRICAPIQSYRDFELTAQEPAFQRFNTLTTYFGHMILDAATMKPSLTLALLCGLERIIRQSAHLNWHAMVALAGSGDKDAVAAAKLFNSVLVPLFHKSAELSKLGELKVAALRVMSSILVHSPREFFNNQFPAFFEKRVLTHLGDRKKTKHSLEILLAVLRGTFAEFELSDSTLTALRHAASRNKVEFIEGRHPWAATVRHDDSADDVKKRLLMLMSQLPFKKISKLDSFQWRVAGRNLLRNIIMQIAAQNLELAFEFLFNTLMSNERSNGLSDVDSCALGLNSLCVLLDSAADFQRFMVATPVHQQLLSGFDPSVEACARRAHEASGLASASSLPLAPNIAEICARPLRRFPAAMWVQKTAGARLTQVIEVLLYLDSKLGIDRLGSTGQAMWPSSIFSRGASLFAVRNTAQQAVLESTTAAPVQSALWWRLDSAELEYDSDEEEAVAQQEQRLLLLHQQQAAAAANLEESGQDAAAAQAFAESGESMAEDVHDDDGFLVETAWRTPRRVQTAAQTRKSKMESAESDDVEPAATGYVIDDKDDWLETESNQTYVAARLCEATAHVQSVVGASTANAKSVYFAPFFDRYADQIAVAHATAFARLQSSRAAVVVAEQAVSRMAASHVAIETSGGTVTKNDEKALQALQQALESAQEAAQTAAAQMAAAPRCVSEHAQQARGRSHAALEAQIESAGISETKQLMLPLLYDAVRCVAHCPNTPAVLSLVVDASHPCYLGRMLLHVDCELQTLASQAMQQLVATQPTLLSSIVGALTTQLFALPRSNSSAISTLLRQLGCLLEAWSHSAAFEHHRPSFDLDAELGDRASRDAQLLDLEAIAAVFLCHPHGGVRMDAVQLAEAVRLTDVLLYDCACKAQLAALARAQRNVSVASLATQMTEGALFSSTSGQALFSPFSPQSTRSLSTALSDAGAADDENRSVLSGVSFTSNLLLAEAAAAAAAGNTVGAAAANAAAKAFSAALANAAAEAPAPPSMRLSAMLQSNCAQLMTAAHAAEVAHCVHFDFAGSGFDIAQLERFSFADWIEGRTGLFWPSCIQEIAHTLNAGDAWQPLRRAIEARLLPVLIKSLTDLSVTSDAFDNAARTQVSDAAIGHWVSFCLALRPERDPDALSGASANLSSAADARAADSKDSALVTNAKQRVNEAAAASGISESAPLSPSFLSSAELLKHTAPQLVSERYLYSLLLSRMFSFDRRDMLAALLFALETAHADRVPLLVPMVLQWHRDASDPKSAPKTFFGGQGEHKPEMLVFLMQTLHSLMLALSEPVRLRMVMYTRPDAGLIRQLCMHAASLDTKQILSWSPNPRRFRNVARLIRNVASALTVLRSQRSLAAPGPSAIAISESALTECLDAMWSVAERQRMLIMLRSWSDRGAGDANHSLRVAFADFLIAESKVKLVHGNGETADRVNAARAFAAAAIQAAAGVTQTSNSSSVFEATSLGAMLDAVTRSALSSPSTASGHDEYASFFDAHDTHFNSFNPPPLLASDAALLGAAEDLRHANSATGVQSDKRTASYAEAAGKEAAVLARMVLGDLQRSCFEAGAALCTLGPVLPDEVPVKAAVVLNINSKVVTLTDEAAPDFNSWMLWALRAEHQRVPMLKALLMHHVHRVLPPMIDTVYASYVPFNDAPLAHPDAVDPSDVSIHVPAPLSSPVSGDATAAPSAPAVNKQLWPTLFSTLLLPADRRHAADLYLHVILAQLVRGNAPSPAALADGFGVPAAAGGRSSALALSRLAPAAKLPVIITPSMLEALHPLLASLVVLAASHLCHPSTHICAASWSMLSLLTPFYVPAELRPNFSMQALLARFRAQLLDTDLLMRRHQACEISAALASFCHPSIVRRVMREFLLRWRQLSCVSLDGWLPERPLLLREHQMSALRVVECIVPWFAALPLDKLGEHFAPVDVQLLFPLLTLSRFHMSSYGVAAQTGVENLWRALMRCPATSLLPAAASWQAKQVALMSSPQLLERQRDNIRQVLHFLLRAPLLTAFATHARPKMPPFEFASLAGDAAWSAKAPTEQELNALSHHLQTYADEPLMTFCRLLTRALFHSNAEAVLHTLFLYLSDVNATIIPPDAIEFPHDDSVELSAPAGAKYRVCVSKPAHLPLSVRQQAMRSTALRLVHDVALLQYSHQAASLHLLLSHAVIALPTPCVHAQPLLGFLLAFLAPKQGHAAVAANCTKLSERMQARTVEFAWHAHIVPLAATASARGASAPNILAELVDSVQRRRGSERVAIEHVVAIAAEWARAKYDHVLDMWGSESLRIAVSSVDNDAQQAAHALRLYGCLLQPARSLEVLQLTSILSRCLATGLGEWTIWRAPGELTRSVAAHGGKLSVDSSTGASAFAASQSEAGRHALHMMRLVLETLHHMALTFYSDNDVAALAPPTGGSVPSADTVHSSATNLNNGQGAALASAASSAGGRMTSFATSMCAPIGARLLGANAAQSASSKCVLTPANSEDPRLTYAAPIRAAEAALLAGGGGVEGSSSLHAPGRASQDNLGAQALAAASAAAPFTTHSTAFADAYVRAYIGADGRCVSAGRPWSTDAFLMYCQLFWIALSLLRSNVAPIMPLSLRLLRAVICHPTFATFLRSFPADMPISFNHLFGSMAPPSSMAAAAAQALKPSQSGWLEAPDRMASAALMQQLAPSSAPSTATSAAPSARGPRPADDLKFDSQQPVTFAQLLKTWSTAPVQGQTKLGRQHQRFLLCGAQWASQHAAAQSSDSTVSDAKPFQGVQQAVISGMLYSECIDDALTLLLECWQLAGNLLVTNAPAGPGVHSRHLLNLVAALPWLCNRLSQTASTTPLQPRRGAYRQGSASGAEAAAEAAASANLLAASSWSQDWGQWCLAAAAAIRTSPLPEALQYVPIAESLEQCAVVAAQAGRFTPVQRFQPLRDIVAHLCKLHFPCDVATVTEQLSRALVAGPVHLQASTLRVAFLFLQLGVDTTAAAAKFERLLRIAASMVSDPTLNSVAEELIGMSVQNLNRRRARANGGGPLGEIREGNEDDESDSAAAAVGEYIAPPPNSASMLQAYEGLPATFLCLEDVIARLPVLFGSATTAKSKDANQQSMQQHTAQLQQQQQQQLLASQAQLAQRSPALSSQSAFMLDQGGITPALTPRINEQSAAPQQLSPSGMEPGSQAPSRAEPAQFSSENPTIGPLLTDPVALSAFQTFVERNFDTDGLDFFLSALDFAREPNAAKAFVKARAIVKKYIALDSADTINIEESARVDILQSFQAVANAGGAVSPSLFVRATAQVQGELEHYVLPAFVQSSEYAELLSR